MTKGPTDRFQLLGTTLERKFRVERIVAEGGFGVVYYATHVALERAIALKVLKTPPELNEKARAAFIEGFAREARATCKINHPNIVQVLDFGVAEMPSGELAPYMALEWLNGRTLREALMERRGRGGRSLHETFALIRPALEALAYAHDEGIAHRDIKPANMMLVPTRKGETLKLLDFGIAKVMEEGEEAGSGQTRTQSSLNAFSLAYAAPEQIGGSRTGPWTDVHAMALIITEIMTDRPPYDGKERTEICCDVLSSTRPTPAKRRVDAGPWEPVLTRALALRPADRYNNCGEFLAALEQALSEAPTSVQNASGRYAAVGADVSQPLPAMAPDAPLPAPGVPPTIIAQPRQDLPLVPVPEEGSNPTTLRGAVTTSPGSDLSARPAGNKTGLLVAGGVLALALGIGGALVMRTSRSERGTARPSSTSAASANPASSPMAQPSNGNTPAVNGQVPAVPVTNAPVTTAPADSTNAPAANAPTTPANTAPATPESEHAEGTSPSNPVTTQVAAPSGSGTRTQPSERPRRPRSPGRTGNTQSPQPVGSHTRIEVD